MRNVRKRKANRKRKKRKKDGMDRGPRSGTGAAGQKFFFGQVNRLLIRHVGKEKKKTTQ